MRTILGALLSSIVFSVSGAANAGVINFTYSGTAPSCATCSESGSGSFSFADSPVSVGLTDLTAFSLVNTYTDSSAPLSATYTYTFNDLLSFAATLDERRI